MSTAATPAAEGSPYDITSPTDSVELDCQLNFHFSDSYSLVATFSDYYKLN